MTNSEPTPVGPAKWKPCPICGKVLLRGANGSRYHPSGRKCPLADLYMTDRQRRSWNNRDHIGELNKMAAPSHFPTEAEGALIRIREIMAGEGCSAEAVMQMEALLIALPAAPEAGEVLRAELFAAEDRYQRDCLGLNNEGDPIGGDPPAGWKPRAEKAEARLAEVEAERDFWRGAVASANAERDAAQSAAKEAEQIPSLLAVIDRLEAERPALIAAAYEDAARIAGERCAACGAREISGLVKEHILRATPAALEQAKAGAVTDAAQGDPVEPLIEAARGMRRIVEEIDGAMSHGTWRDENGTRLKDTPQWVALYNALAALTQPAQGGEG